jgi:ribosomal protein L12E/L44/L45/RPP1/RPP2
MGVCLCQSRRGVLFGLAAAGVGLALPKIARAGTADALVLTCMDYRLIDDALRYFHGRGLTNKYDHIVLAGASAGALGKLGSDWASTFWKHVDTAIQLHHVRELIVVDHRDCGAFKIVYGADAIAERGRETNLHRTLLHKLRAEVGARHPTLRTQLLLMDLDGKVEDLSASAEAEVAAVPAGGGADAGHEPASASGH